MADFAIAAPRVEEMTKTAVVVTTGVMTGVAQGIVTKLAPQFGAIAPVLTWGSLLITPLIGAAGALLTRGIISDAFIGIAAGSSGVFGYSLPGLLPEMGLSRRLGGGSEQLGAGQGVKLLQGAKNAPLRQQTAARVGIEF